MAECVITSVVQKIGNLLVQEAILLYEVREQVKWVETELQRMRCFLKDADDKQRRGDERVKNWVREVIDVACQAEDVIDTFMLRIHRRQRQKGVVGFVKRYAFIPFTLIARHKVGKEIEEIKRTISGISESAVRYKIANLGETEGIRDKEITDLLEARKTSSSYLNDDVTNVVVGLDAHSNMLVNQLLDPNNKRRCVVSIVGMGGLGKSTLAKKVYNDSEIQKRFPVCIWVTVSEDFRFSQLVRDIASSAIGTTKDEMEKMGEGQLKEKLRDFLKQKVYLIVMDDVWGENVWEQMKSTLPDVLNGSRVLFTTRFHEIARAADPIVTPFSLPFLTEEESWGLFLKMVFPAEPGVESVCPENLNVLGQQMVTKCAGLPLAVLVLAGLLSSKVPTHIFWTQVKETMDWESTEDGKHCLNILALSYNNLRDHYLKSCFLYFCSFPEDAVISASELGRLWIAEGFIPQREWETFEDTATGYLEKLAQKSLIQVVRMRSDGSVSTCRIHDLLREMCLKEAKQERFLSIIPGSSCGGSTTMTSGFDRDTSLEYLSSRRLAHPNLTENDCTGSSLPSNLRSLFLRSELMITGSLRILHGLRLLRVLDLCGAIFVYDFPKEIELMTHLRYLKLKSFIPEKIPSSVGKLKNLQTLDYDGQDDTGRIFLKLPKELGELPSLRHLFLRDIKARCIPFTTTNKLQTLKWVHADQLWMEKSLPKLTSLRRLGIAASGEGSSVLESLGKLKLLSSLSISSRDFPVGTVVTVLSNNHHIQKLALYGRWGPEKMIPQIDRFPRNLAKLTLEMSGLEHDPMPVLERLPNLVFLALISAYKGRKMVCSTNGFPRLQVLRLVEMQEIEDWIMDVGAFPNLTYLVICYLLKLAMLPETLQHVTSLKELSVVFSVKDRLQQGGGDDWYKIKHVPTIYISNGGKLIPGLGENERILEWDEKYVKSSKREKREIHRGYRMEAYKI